MKAAEKRRADAPPTTNRANEIGAKGHTRYWVVIDARDIETLRSGVVPPGLISQVIALFHRDSWEGTEAYAARVSEADEC